MSILNSPKVGTEVQLSTKWRGRRRQVFLPCCCCCLSRNIFLCRLHWQADITAIFIFADCLV